MPSGPRCRAFHHDPARGQANARSIFRSTYPHISQGKDADRPRRPPRRGRSCTLENGLPRASSAVSPARRAERRPAALRPRTAMPAFVHHIDPAPQPMVAWAIRANIGFRGEHVIPSRLVEGDGSGLSSSLAASLAGCCLSPAQPLRYGFLVNRSTGTGRRGGTKNRTAPRSSARTRRALLFAPGCSRLTSRA